MVRVIRAVRPYSDPAGLGAQGETDPISGVRLSTEVSLSAVDTDWPRAEARRMQILVMSSI